MNLSKIKQNKSIQELLEFGIINIDKPSGPTSFDISDFVRKKLDLRKTSHFGTLDPRVTGVLPIALNRACKLTGYFLGEDKEYVGIMRVHEEISLGNIKKMIKNKFLGKITQMPPVKSRVKRQYRQREIKRFELFEEDDKTYPCVNLYDFEKAVKEYEEGKDELLRAIIIPAEIIGNVYSIVEINKDNLKSILTGKPIYKKDLKGSTKVKKDEDIAIFCEERFIGMYKVIMGKEVFAKAQFVLQDLR